MMLGKGSPVRVVKSAFTHSAPIGTFGTVERVEAANTPAVPYYWTWVNGYLLGFYRDELEPLAKHASTEKEG